MFPPCLPTLVFFMVFLNLAETTTTLTDDRVFRAKDRTIMVILRREDRATRRSDPRTSMLKVSSLRFHSHPVLSQMIFMWSPLQKDIFSFLISKPNSFRDFFKNFSQKNNLRMDYCLLFQNTYMASTIEGLTRLRRFNDLTVTKTLPSRINCKITQHPCQM